MQLGLKIMKGIGWTLAGRQVQQFSTLITLAILASFLSPSDFGLIGMITVISGFGMLICDTGFSAALIQNQQLNNRHYSSVFWVNLLVGVIVTSLFYASSTSVALFYNSPELAPLMQVLSPIFIVIGTATVPQALLRKEMNFKKLVIIETSSHVFTGLVVIYLAFQGFGVWALVVQIMLQQVIKIVAIWWYSHWRPSLYFSLAEFKEVFTFSANVLGQKVLYYFIKNMDYLLIGRFLGPEILGYYSLAHKIMFIPIRNICQEINKVLFSAFSEIQSDVKLVRALFLQSIKGTALIVMPMLFGMIAIAREFVEAFFGENWVESVTILQSLCVVGILQSIPSSSGVVFQALGRSGFVLILNSVNAMLLFCVLFISVQYGIEITIESLIIYNFIWLFVLLYYVHKVIYIKVFDILGNLLYPLLLSVFMCITVLIVEYYVVPEKNVYVKLLVLIAVGSSVYGVGLCYIYKKNGVTLIKLIGKF